MKNILVIGLSVTAQVGFVEEANLIASKDFFFKKVGIGGIQPYHLRYLLEDILSKQDKADLVLFEIATGAFRNFTFYTKEDHLRTVLFMIATALERNLNVGFLDLARSDIELQNDWVCDLHQKVAERLTMPYINASCFSELMDNDISKILPDGTHTSQLGSKIYAQGLLQELNSMKSLTLTGISSYDINLLLNISNLYKFILAKDILQAENYDSYFYNRGGYLLEGVVINGCCYKCWYIKEFSHKSNT